MDEKTTAKADRATAKTEHRHAGPYGASFDGTERDGKTPVRGLTFERRWTRPDVHPYDEITWEYRTAGIANQSGKSVFERRTSRSRTSGASWRPASWSKYFRGHLGTPRGKRPSAS
jgi:ribonucleoside-diphosphate reductase alpha chain